MSLMSPGPGGAALLGGMQMGMQMSKMRATQDAAKQTDLNQQMTSQRLMDDAFQADVKHVVDRFANAVPGDEGLLSYEYQALAKQYPDRPLPPVETLRALVGKGGLGNQVDVGKYFSRDQAYGVHEQDGRMQEFIAGVPTSVLMDPAGYSYAEGQLRALAKQSGLNIDTMKPYVEALDKRRTIVAAQDATARQSTMDRGSYLDREMDVIRSRAAMAFPSLSGGNFLFPGSPGSRLDPEHQPEFNAIVSRGEQILRENWDRHQYLTAEQVLNQMRYEFRNVPQLQKALGNAIQVGQGAGKASFVPQPEGPSPYTWPVTDPTTKQQYDPAALAPKRWKFTGVGETGPAGKKVPVYIWTDEYGNQDMLTAEGHAQKMAQFGGGQ